MKSTQLNGSYFLDLLAMARTRGEGEGEKRRFPINIFLVFVAPRTVNCCIVKEPWRGFWSRRLLHNNNLLKTLILGCCKQEKVLLHRPFHVSMTFWYSGRFLSFSPLLNDRGGVESFQLISLLDYRRYVDVLSPPCQWSCALFGSWLIRFPISIEEEDDNQAPIVLLLSWPTREMTFNRSKNDLELSLSSKKLWIIHQIWSCPDFRSRSL